MWRISFWLFFSIGYIIINNSIKADFNPYRPNRLHFLPYFNPRSPCGERLRKTIISIPFSEKNRYIFSENDSAAQNRAGFCAIFHILMWISGANLPEKFCSLQVRTK